ncbi:MAG TPA: hypothetical protein VKT70_16125, partial [Stellaceae bacterium]|nr:hypothetical protein [Stellaceae bacterium]
MLLATGGAPGWAADPDAVAIGVGVYNITHVDKAAEFRGEYRFGEGLYWVKPVLGALVTTEGSFYGYGGLNADIPLAAHWAVMPGFAVGYFARGDG